jgi:hypothetical protein
LEAGAYKLQDATGAIWVITQQTVPSVGDQVVIKGQLQFQTVLLVARIGGSFCATRARIVTPSGKN